MTIYVGTATANTNTNVVTIDSPIGFGSVKALRLSNYSQNAIVLNKIQSTGPGQQYLASQQQMVYPTLNISATPYVTGFTYSATDLAPLILAEWSDDPTVDFAGTYPVPLSTPSPNGAFSDQVIPIDLSAASGAPKRTTLTQFNSQGWGSVSFESHNTAPGTYAVWAVIIQSSLDGVPLSNSYYTFWDSVDVIAHNEHANNLVYVTFPLEGDSITVDVYYAAGTQFVGNSGAITLTTRPYTQPALTSRSTSAPIIGGIVGDNVAALTNVQWHLPTVASTILLSILRGSPVRLSTTLTTYIRTAGTLAGTEIQAFTGTELFDTVTVPIGGVAPLLEIFNNDPTNTSDYNLNIVDTSTVR